MASTEKEKAAQKRKYQRRRAVILAAKDKPCADCGGRYPPYVMEFDHVRGKKLYGVASLWGNVTGLNKVKAEIEKCDLVCSNCHKIRSWNQRIWSAATAARIANGCSG